MIQAAKGKYSTSVKARF